MLKLHALDIEFDDGDVGDAKVDELTDPLPLKLALELASLTA